jgi:hypothetical protein
MIKRDAPIGNNLRVKLVSIDIEMVHINFVALGDPISMQQVSLEGKSQYFFSRYFPNFMEMKAKPN